MMEQVRKVCISKKLVFVVSQYPNILESTILYVHNTKSLQKYQEFHIKKIPHSVRPFYCTVRPVCGLVGGQTLGHFMAHIYLACFTYKLGLGHDGTEAKSWENPIYVVKK